MPGVYVHDSPPCHASKSFRHIFRKNYIYVVSRFMSLMAFNNIFQAAAIVLGSISNGGTRIASFAVSNRQISDLLFSSILRASHSNSIGTGKDKVGTISLSAGLNDFKNQSVNIIANNTGAHDFFNTRTAMPKHDSSMCGRRVIVSSTKILV